MNIISKTIMAVALFGAGCGGAGLGVTGPAGQSPTPAFAAQKGEVRITELSEALCSGTLTASRTEANGDLYTVEATFSQLPVRARRQ